MVSVYDLFLPGGGVVKDITYCASKDCPSTECKIKISNNHFEPHEVISMADFSGVCRFYIGWLVSEIEKEG